MADSRRLNRIRDEARRIFPIGPALIALSGGADSAVAAWVAVELGHPVRAIHIHHGLPDSSAMELAAKAVAAELGIDLEVVNVEVPDGPSPEAQARAVRRAAIEASAAESEWLVT
ncbi:MAG: tRNA(Ile)-lysidine synthetase, partial [Acidimicrobiia bacterium]|nr:tRNA(Ile)-lysidine synthetase [Acidimicrobiia bacterium]